MLEHVQKEMHSKLKEKEPSAPEDTKPYGDEIVMEKTEYTNHIQKRLSKALLQAKHVHKLDGQKEGALTQVKVM
ncbi:hypothetical protein E2C01_017096 [Portunus trituberculatus]|uniref:Uncharacterized protein n=1 Tax=Portunus trituberculatus TaxID=210409 RepID=A0A5B7DS96_PORTR|nr:hypothetical protein [Portunus trituberculatus]